MAKEHSKRSAERAEWQARSGGGVQAVRQVLGLGVV